MIASHLSAAFCNTRNSGCRCRRHQHTKHVALQCVIRLSAT
ncbi:hypothetical protein I546_0357 [Mycobacterium kansasii 732]|uniref:Uncharacterized protein n=1 Tax=Mycobacterium kansasii TaxID=1768 RepID=A0A1V3WLD3_MYCKA|nr:hypothetical protein I546_0357 [Mycobacterium kansasii 732]OOK67780.1 hypothetical protein BZL30_7814 [Mycobacterium kansasii]